MAVPSSACILTFRVLKNEKIIIYVLLDAGRLALDSGLQEDFFSSTTRQNLTLHTALHFQ